MPWHILAPAAVACDSCIVRCSAHPRGAFLCNRNEVSHYIKTPPVEIHRGHTDKKAYFVYMIFSLSKIFVSTPTRIPEYTISEITVTRMSANW